MTVEKLGGASLVLLSHLMQCSQVPRRGDILAKGGKCPVAPPPSPPSLPKMKPLSYSPEDQSPFQDQNAAKV